MKLILCKKCQDVVRLIQEKKRSCECGTCSGQYTDELNAWYSGGDFVIPMGFANSSLIEAVYNQPDSGLGVDFVSFVIPKECSTFKKV
jgi:hypothetical protein